MPKSAKEAARASYLRNRAKVLERMRQRRLANIPKHNAYRRAHAHTVRGRAVVVAAEAKREAKRYGVSVSDLTSTQVLGLFVACRYLCAYCDCKPRILSIDHVTPLSKGGANTLQNVVPACMPCNLKKYNGPPKRPVQPLLLVCEVDTKRTF